MIRNATNAPSTGAEIAKPALNSSKDDPKGMAREGAPGARGADRRAPDGSGEANGTVYASHNESLYLKYTSRDGDVLELRAETSEESYSSETVRFGATARAQASGTADGQDAREAETAGNDPKAKQLAELREWAKQVERELRLQQHELLERILKQSGRRVDSGDGKFLVFCMPSPEKDAESAASDEEANVPPYWNAENTSDRIVHFATQMAEISGLDPKEFAEKMREAVGKGFDQAAEATGPLTGAAGKLNRDTRELVFAKLSKWLEARESEEYNQGAENPAAARAESASGQG
ncbi:MAG TPA: hypothetical protein VJ385_23160 [Fibrobacteria bacterium]|nr:hypothetical protein [Fibrobacteria bacterium]